MTSTVTARGRRAGVTLCAGALEGYVIAAALCGAAAAMRQRSGHEMEAEIEALALA
jgi:hypothetical protein